MLTERLATRPTGRNQGGASALEGVARDEGGTRKVVEQRVEQRPSLGVVRKTFGHPGAKATSHSGTDEAGQTRLGRIGGDLEQRPVGCDPGSKVRQVRAVVPG